ncbi:MAG TPA: hypothetical protein VGV64_00665 [Thermoplasmata archaeon]|nr:hypothetical protein [Thermoplasmata archaeon]
MAVRLTEIGQALRARLSSRIEGPRFFYADDRGEESPGIAGATSHDIALRLIDAAALSVRRGTTTVVAYPLRDPDEVQIARRRIARLVRVSLGPAPAAASLDPIPTTCRCVRDRQVVELAFLPDPMPTIDRPDIILRGPLDSPDDLSREIADVLFRAGWLTQASPTPRLPELEGGPHGPMESTLAGLSAPSPQG